MATPPEKDSAAAHPEQPASATEKVQPSVPASLAERLVDALQKTVTAGSATPAEGKITTDEKSRYLAELAAYKCLNEQADAIGGQINQLRLQNARIRMVDSLNVVGDDLLLQQMLAELSYWEHKFADKLNALELLFPHGESTRDKSSAMVGAAGTTIVASLLGVLPSIVSLFRSDLELKGQQVAAPSRTALQMRVAHCVNGVMMLPQLRQVTDCTLLQSLLKTETKRREFSRSLDQLKLEIIQPKQNLIAELELQISKLGPDDTDAKSRLDGELKLATSELQTPNQELTDGKALLADYDKFRAQANAPAEGGKPSLLQRACWSSVLIDSDVTHLLYVEPISMGGTEVIAKSICNLGSPSLHYVGGCVAAFVLATRDGQVVAADTCVATSQLDFKIKHRKRILCLF